MDERIISLAEAGKRYFGVKPETAREYVKQGKIPAFRVGKNYLVSVAEMEKRYHKLSAPSPHEVANNEICWIVRSHIALIELALLQLCNNDPGRDFFGIPASEVARLANTLRELTNA